MCGKVGVLSNVCMAFWHCSHCVVPDLCGHVKARADSHRQPAFSYPMGRAALERIHIVCVCVCVCSSSVWNVYLCARNKPLANGTVVAEEV